MPHNGFQLVILNWNVTEFTHVKLNLRFFNKDTKVSEWRKGSLKRTNGTGIIGHQYPPKNEPWPKLTY